MANIELPKDAEGREIPMDTEVLYDKEGKRREVDWYTFYPDKDRLDVVFEDSCVRFSPNNLSLTKPDSWEKLAEDLNRAWDVGNAQEKGCRYMSCYYDKGRGAHCNDCRLNSNGKMSCLDAMMADIISRVNRLVGDSE